MRINFKFLSILLLVAIIGFAFSFGHRLPKPGEHVPIDTWQLADVEGHLPNLKFALTSDNNKPVTQAVMNGYITLLFFGFTTCPDECPATMMRLAGLLRQLGKEADHIRVLFVTVDPGIDTPQALHDYLKNFDPDHMIGLTGSDEEIRALAKRYRAAYQPRSESGNADEITHADGVYVFDQQGHARLLATPSDSDENILHDLRILAKASEAP